MEGCVLLCLGEVLDFPPGYDMHSMRYVTVHIQKRSRTRRMQLMYITPHVSPHLSSYSSFYKEYHIMLSWWQRKQSPETGTGLCPTTAYFNIVWYSKRVSRFQLIYWLVVHVKILSDRKWVSAFIPGSLRALRNMKLPFNWHPMTASICDSFYLSVCTILYFHTSVNLAQ